jgi:hypothetical protein
MNGRPEHYSPRNYDLEFGDDIWLEELPIQVVLSPGAERPRLDEVVAVLEAWSRVGAYGAFGGKVHDVDIKEIDSETPLVRALLDVGSAGWQGLNYLLRILDGLAEGPFGVLVSVRVGEPLPR